MDLTRILQFSPKGVRPKSKADLAGNFRVFSGEKPPGDGKAGGIESQEGVEGQKGASGQGDGSAGAFRHEKGPIGRESRDKSDDGGGFLVGFLEGFVIGRRALLDSFEFPELLRPENDRDHAEGRAVADARAEKKDKEGRKEPREGPWIG